MKVDLLDKSAESITRRRRHWYLLIGWVCTFYVGLLAAGYCNPPANGLSENRILASFPTFPKTLADWSALPSRLDEYFRDHLPLRGQFICFINLLRFKMGYSGSQRVIVGKKGWLFYYSDLDYFQIVDVPQSRIVSWQENLRRRLQIMRELKVPYYVLFAPKKPTIYPEMLPDWMLPPAQTELSRFINHAQSQGIDSIVTVHDKLLVAKKEAAVYPPFDTHWTSHGAYVAYNALFSRIAHDIPELAPLPLGRFNAAPLRPEQINRDLALMLGVANYILLTGVGHTNGRSVKKHYLTDKRNDQGQQLIETGNKNGKTILMTTDSFGPFLLPFVEPHFERIILTHFSETSFPEGLIRLYKPDVVVLVLIESAAPLVF